MIDPSKSKFNKMPFSGSNYANTRSQGISYDEAKKIYADKEKTGQSSVDPSSLAQWAILNGYTPAFGDTSVIYNQLLKRTDLTPEQKKNVDSFSQTLDQTDALDAPQNALIKQINSKVGGLTVPTVDSEIARAKQVWENADSLAGTGKYVGKTADQIRESAHAYAESLRNGGTIDPTAGGTYTPQTTAPTSPVTTATQPTTPADPVANAAGYDAALKQMESDPNFKTLPPSIQSLFKETLKSYDFNKELNVPNVLSEFNRIKTETIDPRFSQEVNKFTNDLTKEVQALNVSRDIEKEALATQAGQDIRQARAGLEKAGMTFTGQGVEQLGAGSAYAQPGANVATPVQTGFGGLFNEGTVNQSSRLMASSASNRYKQSLNALGQQAENALGGAAVPGLVPGYSPSGTLPGSFADTKQAQYGQTLSQLMGQNYQNIGNNKNLNYNL